MNLLGTSDSKRGYRAQVWRSVLVWMDLRDTGTV